MFKSYLKSIILLGSVFCSVYSYAQKTLTIPPATLNPNCTTTARDAIYLKSPLNIVPDVSCPTKTIKIDESIIANTEYNEIAIDPSSRPLNTDLPVGTTLGSINVSDQIGAALYNIPIEVPPGTLGMEPSISIAYNSQSGNGLLGYGWNISGLSAISRTGKNLYTDGVVTGVTFVNTNDKFVLDGNRLVLQSGTYGVVGSVYYTQNETFSRISLLNDGNNKSYFKVETKDGKIIRYGCTESPYENCNSRIELGSSTGPVLNWMVTDISDKMGNYVRFYYHKDYTKNEFWIERIDYTGNTIAGMLPYNSINFYYETRIDANNVYLAGNKLQNNVILRKIKTFNEGKLIKKFDLEYVKDATNLYSVLNEIKEYGSDGSTYNSIVIGRGNKGVNFQTASSNIVAGQSVDLSSGDYNNDGYSDILASSFVFTQTTPNFKYHTDLKLYLNNKNGSYDLASPPLPLPVTYSTIEGIDTKIPNGLKFLGSDFNGDGKEDLLLSKTTISSNSRTLEKFNIYWSQGNSFSTTGNPEYFPTTYNKINNNGTFLCVGDYDGDGSTDFVTALSDGNTYLPFMYSPKHWNPTTGVNPYKINDVDGFGIQLGTLDNFMSMDFNGDGKDELVVVCDLNYISTTRIYSLSTPSDNGPTGLTYDVTATLLYSDSYPTKNNKCFYGDFNGDGKTDILVAKQDNTWEIAYSTGIGFQKIPFNFNEPIGYDDISDGSTLGTFHVKVGDYNGDAKSDILVAYYNQVTSSSRANLYLSNGNSFLYSINVKNGLLGGTLLLSSDCNGDGKMDEIMRDHYTSPFEIFYFDKNGQELLTTQIADGLNNNTKINYSLLTDNTVYTKVPNEGDVICLQRPICVVSSISVNDGKGSDINTNFTYEGFRIHQKGLGLLGFSKTTKTNMNGIISSYYNYLNNPDPSHPYCFNYLSKVETKNSSGSPISNQTNTIKVYTYPLNKRIFTYTSSIDAQNFLTGMHTVTDYLYNNPANNLSDITTYYKSGTTNLLTKYELYSNYIAAGSWLENKCQNTTVTYARSGQPSFTRVNSYTWDTNTGILLTEKDDYSNVTTTYTPNNTYGVITQIKTSGVDFSDRISTIQYDEKYRFVTKTTQLAENPLYNLVTEAQYDPATGNVIWSKDENGLVSTNQYDGFGRLTKSVLPNGKTVDYIIDWRVNDQDLRDGLSLYALYYTKVKAQGSPEAKEYKDILGRTLYKSSLIHDNYGLTKDIYSTTTYNNKGLLESTSYLDPAGNEQQTNYTYDPYNRIKEIVSPIASKTYTYAAPTATGYSVTETINETGQSKTTLTDLTGLTASVTDNGGTIAYTYGSNSQPVTISTGGTTTTISYDVYGQQVSLVDPNAGTTTYEYYLNGELKKQSDAKGNIYNMTYDVFGRLKTKTITKTNEPTLSYTYNYDTETNGLGKVASINEASSGTSQTFKYDYLGRNYQLTETNPDNSFTTNYTYNDYGNVTGITYPGGYQVTNVYDNLGSLTEVKQTSDNKSIWKLSALDYMSHITQYTTADNSITSTKSFDAVSGYLNRIQTGNIFNYSYDFEEATGNLLQRKDNLRSLTEDFTYDNLDRLKTITQNGVLNTTMNYEDNGNIQKKSDLSASNYVYDDPLHPNAVTKVVSAMGITTGTLSTEYNLFNKINHIGDATGEYDLNFTYGVDQGRIKMETYVGNVKTKTKYYALGYEKEINHTTQDVKEWNYISGGDGLAAIYIVNNGTGKLYWIAKDHLGSIMGLYNEAGTMEQEYSYDAWGKRRLVDNWNSNISFNTDNFLTVRGYTSHEHLDKVNLINMNGRLYDPLTARMLSPDNFVQDATTTQNFNRYSYCINNPLKYTDPDGNWFGVDDGIAALIGGVVNLGSNLIQGNVHSFWQGVGYFGAGAVAGDLALYGPAGWAAGGAILGASNAALGGGTGDQIIQQGVVGAFSGLVGGAAGQWAANGLGGVVVNGFHIASPVVKGIVTGAIGGAAGGYAGGFTAGYLTTGSVSAANQAGVNGMITGAGIGGTVGGVAGYRQALRNDVNPWTGKHNNSVTIGEGMTSNPEKGWFGVDKISKDLGSGKYEPDPSIPQNVDLLGKNIGTTSELMYDNAVWIEMQMEQNVIIYDRGPVGNNSQYYNMELGRTMNYNNTYTVKAIYNYTQTIRILILYK